VKLVSDPNAIRSHSKKKPDPKKIAIIGTRDYPDLQKVRDFVYDLPEDIEVISGGARGPDTAAEQAARERGLKVTIFKPEGHMPKDYLRRNRQIVDYSELVVAFWVGRSSGTGYTINYATDQGKTVLIR
jgi:predicted Rossmann fold nucleotide-binding protein DprA/Smf involved in DNA uptake